MKKINHLGAISGGFSTEGAISATIVAIPLAIGVACLSGGVASGYTIAGITAATIVYHAELLKKCDKALIQFGQSLLNDNSQNQTTI